MDLVGMYLSTSFFWYRSSAGKFGDGTGFVCHKFPIYFLHLLLGAKGSIEAVFDYCW
jgi:hypothetical protein